MRYYEDPILGKGRAADISGGTGGSGTTYIGGFAIGIFGETISRLRYMPIESVTGNSVTLQAGHAYKAYATSTAITLNTETVPEGQFGLEGHIEICVAGTGYVVTGSNVVLANALEPDAVNNCTVRFHDGIAIISVEDHVAGYIVVSATGTTAGTLPYALGSASQEYVAFDATLNGQTLDLAGATTYAGEKHVVGNGYAETIVSGGITCTSKTTFSNLSMQNVAVNGGTMTLGDVFIPSGSTVAVSSGARVIIDNGGRVTGDGGTLNLGNTRISTFGASYSYTVSGLSLIQSDGISIDAYNTSGDIYLKDCVFPSPNNTTLNVVAIRNGATVHLSGCTFSPYRRLFVMSASGTASFSGSNTILCGNLNSGTVRIESGAVLNFTDNTNAAPINSGGTVIVDGGCQIITSDGSTVSIAGGTYMQINNDGTAE